MTAAVGRIGELLECQRVQLWQADVVNEALRLLTEWTPAAGAAQPADDTFKSPGEGLAGQAWVAGERQTSQAGARGVGLPILGAGRVIGVLCIYRSGIDSAELTALAAVCSQLAHQLERYRTESVQLELAAAQESLARVARLVRDNVWTVELLADGTVRSVFASSDGSDVFGGRLPRDGDMGAMMLERTDPRDQHLFQGYHDALAAGQRAEIETRILGIDGVTRWIWTRATPRQEGQRLFVDGISTNVTERREVAVERERLLVEQERQVQRLREIDQMKDDLVAVVSHELRNPIATIRGCLDLMWQQMADNPAEPLLKVIDRQTEHMATLVDDLLTLGEVESGLGALASSQSLVQLLRSAAADHAVTAQAAGVKLELEIEEPLQAVVHPTRLRQALDNLLSNAIKYTPTGGQAQLMASVVGDQVVITVADTGIGVPPEDFPHLFDRFFRSRSAVQRGIKGTGLGLAIVQAIMRAHGGSAAAHPRPGGGTVFQLTLPAG